MRNRERTGRGVMSMASRRKDEIRYRVTVSTAVFVTPPEAAEMVTDLDLFTRVVVMVNVALVLLAGTVTLAGSLAYCELSLSETTIPPVGAGPLSLTVPWEVAPPLTVVGLNVSVLNAGRFTVSTAVFVTPL